MNRIAFAVYLLIASCCQASGIIEISEGLTLAQVVVNGQFHVLAVTAGNGRGIRGVDISKYSDIYGDIPSVFQQLGYHGIQDIVLNHKQSTEVSFPYAKLMSPAGTGVHHIALGLNYNEHAEEVEAEHMPFLFLKMTLPTRQQHILTGEGELLDYEVEVCARPLHEIKPDTDSGKVEFGYFICGDFTDRTVLMRNMNLEYMQSGEGFSIAKSGIGYLPTGPYMVVPKNNNKFMASVDIKLYRNGELKQHGSSSNMVWPLETIIRKTFLAEQTQQPTFSDRSTHWLTEGTLTTDMIFLTGTPEGVIMQAPGTGYKILSAMQFIFTGAFLNTSVSQFTVEKYIPDKLKEGVFLQPGERVTMHGTFLGRVDIEIGQK